MAAIYAVNPRKGKGSKKRGRKSRSRGYKTKATRTRRRRRTHILKHPGKVVVVNPRRKRGRRHHRRTSIATYRRPRALIYTNPRAGDIRDIGGMMLSGLGGAAGGLLVDVVTGFLSGILPSALTSGGLGTLATKTALGIGAGFGAEALWKGRGAEVAAGTLAVVFHEYLGSYVSGMFASSPSSGTTGAGAVQPYGVNPALLRALPGYYTSPAPVAGTLGSIQPYGVNPGAFI